MFKNLKIGSRLALSYSVIAFILIVIIFLSMINLNKINQSVQDLVNDKFIKTVWANDVIDIINLNARCNRNILLLDPKTQSKEIQVEFDRIKAARVSVDSLSDSLKARMTSKQGIVLFADFEKDKIEYRKTADELRKLMDLEERKPAIEYLFKEVRTAQLAYMEATMNIIKYQTDLVNLTGDESIEAVNSSILILIVIGIIAIILAVLIAIWITKSITKPINSAVIAAENIAKGNMKIDLDSNSKDETGILINSMKKMAGNISNLILELNKTADAAVQGKLDNRADEIAFEGDYKNILKGFNATLDAVIGPLNVTAEYVDRISKGDIPPKITDQYKGDFNEIKNNINLCIDSINLLVTDAGMLTNAAAEGKLDTRADVSRHGGDFRAIVQGVNNTLDNVIGPLNVAAEYIDRISKGDIPPKITDQYKGDFNEIKNNINLCIDSINLLVTDAGMLTKAAAEGKLDTRADVSRHGGDFRAIVQGVNNTLDNVIGPLNVAAEYIDRISKGDIPTKITDQYKGDFNEIKNNINLCIDSINLLVTDTMMLTKAADDGKLDTRADVSRHGGDFRAIVQGVNNTLDNVIGPLNVAAEYIDRISKGDIPPKITDQYKGDFNEIKNNINLCIDSINLLVTDAVMLTKAAEDGKLDTRADVSRHGGNFRAIIQGVNNTLDNVIGPLNVAAEYIDRISKGDIPPKITDQYKGDFNEIKNNLNQCIVAVQLLVSDTLELVASAEKGNLETRADAVHHYGDFRKIVEGVNKTLDLVVTPIEETSNVMSIFATGDLTVRILNEYQGDFAKLKNDVNKFAQSLSELIMQLSEAIHDTAGAAHEISSTAESLAAASQEQSAQADEVAGAVEDMSRTITQNAMSASRTAEVATKNSTMASESGKVVEQTVNKMKDIAAVVKKSALNIEQLGESSKQIGEIISVIDDIADQTNLLALNAAIEAARAGEQGRGFAVVADEVRKLAERTTDATKQIAKMIKGIQKETEEAVIAMNKGTIEVQSGIELADKAGDSLKQILSSTHEVLDMVNLIASASEEQSATSEEISKNVLAISKVTGDSAVRVEEVAKTADSLASMTEQLRNMVAAFKVEDKTNYSTKGTKHILSNREGRQLSARI